MDITSFILGLQKGKSMGGGSVAGVHYVTFIYPDAKEPYVRPVADGDDCADIVARGLISTPTKKSTAQHDYTYSGWSLTEGGAASTAALANVTEDRTVYAAFTASVRYYTITYYDSDGMTVLKTASLAYGSHPNYVPEKEGYSFGGWTPDIVTVEGNASYIATWEEKITFAGGSWADIAEICESGEAANTFKVGDIRTEQYDGNTFEFRIIGINFDNKADGSGKAGITIAASGVNKALNTMAWDDNTSAKWEASDVRTWLRETFFATLPLSLQNVIKTVSKTTSYWYEGGKSIDTTETVFLPSSQELQSAYLGGTVVEGLGQYPYLNVQSQRIFKDVNGTAIYWWTRTQRNTAVYRVHTNGQASSTATATKNDTTLGVLPCFCI